MEWIDTSKQLPSQDKEGWSRQVLTYDTFGNINLCNLVHEDWKVDSGGKKNEFITYWMELPEEPV